MDITTEDYQIRYDSSTETVSCQGSLRLAGTEEYLPLANLLKEAAAQSPGSLTLDLRQLRFLNSSGINMLSKFVLQVRQQGSIQLRVRGAQEVPWQGKSLKNLQRLMPSMILDLE